MQRTSHKLLVVDDDPALSRTLRRALTIEGYDVECAEDGSEALQRLAANHFDAVVLDVSMPRLDGLAVCRRMRERRDRTPVLMLTARDAIGDRVSGLDAGADDYLVKPFALDELNARVRALLRRAAPENGEGERLNYLDLELDLTSARARRGDRTLELTRTEQRLLELLLRNPEQVLPRDMIYERVWGHDISATSNSLDVYVGYLRRKTEEGGESRLIHTVRGVGFRLTD
ncbi:MAG TPA: response regulator transcription factor [Solirubrobacteraceae bacterium]|nr:response regulator transcription factor [Solirubrobacteraceae bacterium]